MRLGLGTDEDDALRFQRRAEGSPLGQEAVAGMHGLRARRLAGLDDLFGDEIALRGRRRADMHRLVGHLDMHGVAIGIRIDGDSRDAHLPRRLDDAAGDLATIGDQYFLEHAECSPSDASFYGFAVDGQARAGHPIQQCCRRSRR